MLALSVWIFGETFTSNVARLAVGSFAFAAMCIFVTVLARTAPATMDPDSAPAIAET